MTDSAVNYCEVGDAVSALYDDGESYSATVTEVTGSDITVTYSDDDTSTYDLTESGNVVQTASGADCVTTCDSSTLDTEVWGNQWSELRGRAEEARVVGAEDEDRRRVELPLLRLLPVAGRRVEEGARLLDGRRPRASTSPRPGDLGRDANTTRRLAMV